MTMKNLSCAQNFSKRKLSDFHGQGKYCNDYRVYAMTTDRVQAKYWEHWVLEYDGSKNVSTFTHKNVADLKNPYYCHMVVSRNKNWQTDTTHFAIIRSLWFDLRRRLTTELNRTQIKGGLHHEH